MKSYVFMDRINRIYQLVLYQIRHFAAVAATGSFTTAATSLRTKTSDMTILCFAFSNDRVRTRDESRFALTKTSAVNVQVRDVAREPFQGLTRADRTNDRARAPLRA